MKQLLAALCACLALGLVVAGCGGDDDGGDGGDSAATTEQPAATTEQTAKDRPASGGAKAGGQFEIEVVDIDYDPREATVPAGTTVKWTNTGNLPHTVTKQGGPGEEFDSGTMDTGDTFEHTFETAGKIDYHCTIHPGQDGSVSVE